MAEPTPFLKRPVGVVCLSCFIATVAFNLSLCFQQRGDPGPNFGIYLGSVVANLIGIAILCGSLLRSGK